MPQATTKIWPRSTQKNKEEKLIVILIKEHHHVIPDNERDGKPITWGG